MPHYTFYPTRSDGLSASILSSDLACDAAAAAHALRVLDEHESATCVVVYCGDRKISTRYRTDSDLKAVPACIA